MTRHTPPRLATYVLQHFAPRYQREALIGDLLEEHARGRSSAWLWGQVLCALGCGAQQAIRAHIRAHRPALITIAAWWSTLVYLTYALRAPLILLALDPSIYWWLNRLAKRRAVNRAMNRETALLLVLLVVLALRWGLPHPAQAAPSAQSSAAPAAVAELPHRPSGSIQTRRAAAAPPHAEAPQP